jgi:hypothetical protein
MCTCPVQVGSPLTHSFPTSAVDWQRKALEIQNQARLEVTAARQEALETAQELGSSQKLTTRLQQQLDDALVQQQSLRGSLQQLELTAGKHP